MIIAWLVFVLCCGWIVSRASFTDDLAAFLPSNPTQDQRLLVDLIKEGMVSRLILVGIEDADAATRARLSKDMTKRLREYPLFSVVENGDSSNQERDQKFLFANRYLLSPAITAEHFQRDRIAQGGGRIYQSTGLFGGPAAQIPAPPRPNG